jgi:hypothetical protein
VTVDAPMAKIFTRAAELLLERGWCQGTFESKTGEICPLKALQLAQVEILGNWPQPGLMAKLMRALGTGAHAGAGAAEWNDAPERTLPEVLTALHAAAANR